MSRLREALQRIEQRAAAASADHQPALRVDLPAAGHVPPSKLFAGRPAPAAGATAAAANSQSTVATGIIDPESKRSTTPWQPPVPVADLPRAVPAVQPDYAQASFADVANTAVPNGVERRIDPPQRADQDHAADRTVHAQHKQPSPHLPPVSWKSATPSSAAKNEEYSEPARPGWTAEETATEEPSNRTTSAMASAVPAAEQEGSASHVEPAGTDPAGADPAAQSLSAADLIIPPAPPDSSEPTGVSIHPSSPIAAPHIPASRFAAAADSSPAVAKPFQQTCRKILASLPNGSTPTLLFAAVDAPYNSSTMANLAIAMTDQIDAPILAIDASRDAALTKELRVKSTNALMRILRGTTSWEDCIVQTSVPGLCLLPSKPGQDRVAPFAFQRLLAELRNQFGLLLIDIGTFDETTALALAGLCTGTYLTVRQGHTTKDRARAAQRQLKSNGASLAGCVLISPTV